MAMSIADRINKAVKTLELDKEFPHMHFEGCYSYDGHRTDLDCNLTTTPRACDRCNGTGKQGSWACGRCRSRGIEGGTLEAQKKILQYLERDEALERLLQDS